MGAKVAFADALNREELTAAIKGAEPEVIIHQLTARKKGRACSGAPVFDKEPLPQHGA